MTAEVIDISHRFLQRPQPGNNASYLEMVAESLNDLANLLRDEPEDFDIEAALPRLGQIAAGLFVAREDGGHSAEHRAELTAAMELVLTLISQAEAPAFMLENGWVCATQAADRVAQVAHAG